MSKTDNRALFQVYVLNQRGQDRIVEIQNHFMELIDKLEDVCAEGREMALVRTKLQEASFFARRAAAQDPRNQLAGEK